MVVDEDRGQDVGTPGVRRCGGGSRWKGGLVPGSREGDSRRGVRRSTVSNESEGLRLRRLVKKIWRRWRCVTRAVHCMMEVTATRS